MISVIVPALEVDVELRRCIDSIHVACGGLPRCEVIVVLPQRRMEEARLLCPDAMVICESRPSIYAAMNDGVKASSGFYLYFIGKDDIVLAPFAAMLRLLEETWPSAMFCDVYWGDRGIYSGKPSRLRLLTRNVCHQGIIYSRASLDRHGPYLRKMRVEADKLLNLRLLWDTELAPSIQYQPIPVAWYSGSGFSSSTTDPLFRKLYPVILRRYVGCWAAALLVGARRVLGR